jgi:aldehyde dehydrogenase (NAD+)
VNPATGQVDAVVPLAGVAEIDQAVEAAEQAFRIWRDTRPAERRRLLLRLADLIEEHRDEFIRRAVLDNGTPLATAEEFFGVPAEWTRYYAGFADKIQGRVTSTMGPDGEFGYTLSQPYGVIGIIVTWNAPLNSLSMKIPAALAAGNTVVVKPAESTPFAASLFADVVELAGFPPGVINILPGTAEAGARLVAHPSVKKISFTGGPATAQAILHACAEQMKPSILELGGKSANLIFPDADLDTAIPWGTLRAVGVMAGQTCGAPSRMLVHRSVYAEVLSRVEAVTDGITIGDPFDRNTLMGPVINESAVSRILSQIDAARADGSRLLVGGDRAKVPGFENGCFLEPTVFADVDPRSEIAQTEVFGPVLCIIPFTDEDEAIAIANSTPFGLSSYIQTKDLLRAHRVAEQLVAGGTMINGAPNLMACRPFGGLGLSGFGKEGGAEGLAEFQRTKTIAIQA